MTHEHIYAEETCVECDKSSLEEIAELRNALKRIDDISMTTYEGTREFINALVEVGVIAREALRG